MKERSLIDLKSLIQFNSISISNKIDYIPKDYVCNHWYTLNTEAYCFKYKVIITSSSKILSFDSYFEVFDRFDFLLEGAMRAHGLVL